MVEEPRVPASLTWSVLAFVAVYGLIATSLFAAAVGDLRFLLWGIALLSALLTALVLLGVFANSEIHRKFYLAAAILPVFTLINLTLVGTLPALTQALVSYLVLGIALIVYQQATGARIPPEGLQPRRVFLSIPTAIPLGLGIALVAVLLFSRESPYPMEEVITAVLVAAAVAFVDEYLYRGILQFQVAAVSRPALGWLAAVLLFVASAAPSGDFLMIAYRAWIGLLLGFLVWWRQLLPLALMVRAVAAIALVVLTPSFEAFGVLG